MTDRSNLVSPQLISFAHQLADAARPIAQHYFRQRVDIISKADDSPVTIADREAEAAMRALIEDAFPDHGIYGEEYGPVRTDAEYVWVLDPIDGTRAFITGMPVFGTLIGLAKRGDPVLGVLEQPIMEERWIGVKGQETHYTKAASEPIAVSVRRTVDLSAAALYFTSPDQLDTEKRRSAFETLYQKVQERRFGGDCYSTGLLASGHIDLHVECGVQPYDFMALAPIIEAAGGVAATWDGKPLNLTSGDTFIGAATPALMEKTVDILSSAA